MTKAEWKRNMSMGSPVYVRADGVRIMRREHRRWVVFTPDWYRISVHRTLDEAMESAP